MIFKIFDVTNYFFDKIRKDWTEREFTLPEKLTGEVSEEVPSRLYSERTSMTDIVRTG